MPVASVTALQLSQLLGALLASVVDAQAQAARATIEFVEDIGFETTASGERLRNVKVRYFKKDENDQRAEFVLEVPLLALVNIPSLAIRQAKLSFSYDIVTVDETRQVPVAAGASMLNVKLPMVKITGFVRKPPVKGSDSERRTSSLDLEVTVEQQEMPVGIERLFDLAELGISERLSNGGADTG